MILYETYKNRLLELAGVKLLNEVYISKVLYHGTNADFDDFDSDLITSNTEGAWNGAGFYFTDSKQEASWYGNNIIQAQITLHNPLDLTKIKDTSINGSGIVKLFANTKGLGDIKFQGKTYVELNNILNKLEFSFDYKNISYSEGTKDWFQHVWYNNGNNEYVLRNKTKHEIDSKEHLKNQIIHTILSEKYNVIGLPIRISEAINPFSFSHVLKQNGYDGVIAENSNFAVGFEYVVFDKKNIKILK